MEIDTNEKMEFWRQAYRLQHKELQQAKIALESILESARSNKDNNKVSQQLALSGCAYIADLEIKRINEILNPVIN